MRGGEGGEGELKVEIHHEKPKRFKDYSHNYVGKSREEYHPYDRRDGTGRGKGNRKGGYKGWEGDKKRPEKEGELAEKAAEEQDLEKEAPKEGEEEEKKEGEEVQPEPEKTK